MVYGRVGGKNACVDLTEISPLVGLGIGDFIVGRTALKATYHLHSTFLVF
jgi:hypothetical protein